MIPIRPMSCIDVAVVLVHNRWSIVCFSRRLPAGNFIFTSSCAVRTASNSLITPSVRPECPTVTTVRLWWARPLKCLIWAPVSFITGLWYRLQRISTTLVKARFVARRKSKSRHWIDRQHRDPFVKGSQKEGYSSRAVYKLSEIDQKDHLIMSGDSVLDLGAAPGGWSQYAATRVGVAGRVFAIDKLPIAPIKGVVIIQGDITTESLVHQLKLRLENEPVGLVLSDMAPNLTGIKAADQANSLVLARVALSVALKMLGSNGRFMVKVFEGEGTDDFRRDITSVFGKVVVRKPKASRLESAEYYLLASNPRECIVAGS